MKEIIPIIPPVIVVKHHTPSRRILESVYPKPKCQEKSGELNWREKGLREVKDEKENYNGNAYRESVQ